MSRSASYPAPANRLVRPARPAGPGHADRPPSRPKPGLGHKVAAVMRPRFWGLLGPAALGAEDVLSQLRPPKPLLGPSFWERYGVGLLVAGLGLLIAAGLFGLWRRRTRASQARAGQPPHLQARQALTLLQGTAEDDRVAMEVSRLLRHYVQQAFQLPPGEATPAELQAALRPHPQAGPELADALAQLLRDCDLVKFAPVRPAEPQDLVGRALELLDQFEHRRRLASPGPPQQPP